MLLRTPLFEMHRTAGARFVDFGGWEMPVQYTGIQAEHLAARTSAVVFDVSHMGEIEVVGPDAIGAVNALVTNDLEALVDGQAAYTAMCQPDGGIVDDLVVYRFSRAGVLICCNASNRAKDFAWISANITDEAVVRDVGDAWAQLAVQGPKAVEIVQKLTETPLAEIKRYHFAEGLIAGAPAIISRTGYTGEDGFELYLPAEQGAAVWKALFEAGGESLVPAGLGCRDTLRLEMKYALYGNDIDETTTPLEAGLGWITKLGKGEFIGKSALVAQKAAGVPRRLIAFKMTGRAIPRPGYRVLDAEGEAIGHVTSGTRSPVAKIGIGMAYVKTGAHRSGTPIAIEIRGRTEPALIVRPPFITPGSAS